MNKTVINGVLPWLLPQIASGSAAEPAVIDLFDALGGKNLSQPGITCDGCHPVDKGYIEMGNAIYAVSLYPAPHVGSGDLGPPHCARMQVLSHLRETEEPDWPAFDQSASDEQMLVRHPPFLQNQTNVPERSLTRTHTNTHTHTHTHATWLRAPIHLLYVPALRPNLGCGAAPRVEYTAP